MVEENNLSFLEGACIIYFTLICGQILDKKQPKEWKSLLHRTVTYKVQSIAVERAWQEKQESSCSHHSQSLEAEAGQEMEAN